ncbi:MAG: serine hydrolase domain-containing protein [Woeseiaceae bacterium]|nr:serine hydrolase domain-containing protein [Woeseiaceae bacterium]
MIRISMLQRPFAAILMLTAVVPAAALDVDRFDDIVAAGMERWRVPGLAVAVIEDGEVVLQRGYGRAAPDGAAVDEHTLFANASTTKAMVVAGLLILADEERLSLDDLVIEHLPEVHLHSEALTQQVTIRDLLAHRTGLPRTDFWTFRQLTPLPEQVRKLRLVEPAAAPRTRLLYQNTMYELAGLIIERVSGQRWDAFLRKRLWQPIGMLETYGTRGQIPATKQHVVPHDEIDGTVRQIPFDLPLDREDAAGSAWSSVHDMTLWAQFLLRGGVTADGRRLISEDAMAAMFEPHQFATPDDFYPTVELTEPHWRTYGLGWFQQDFQGRKIDFHTGSLDGLVAIIGLDPANAQAVVVLQNMDGSELRHALLWEVHGRAAGGRTPRLGRRRARTLYGPRRRAARRVGRTRGRPAGEHVDQPAAGRLSRHLVERPARRHRPGAGKRHADAADRHVRV